MNIYSKLLQTLNRKLAIWRLKKRYKYLIEVDKLMEEFTTRTILDGGSEEFLAKSRRQLVSLQNDIKSKERLIEFLKQSK